MLPEQKLDALVARHRAVEGELATQVTPETYVKLSREFAELDPVVEAVKNYRGVVSEITDLDALITEVELIRHRGSFGWVRGVGRVDGEVAVEGELSYSLIPSEAPAPVGT